MIKFNFELDGIDSDALFGMINRQRLKYIADIMSAVMDEPVSHARVSHLIGLVHNVDDIEATVYGKPVEYTDLRYLDVYNTVDFPPD